MTDELMDDNERRQFRRVFPLVPEEDVVLFSVGGNSHFVAKLLDLSRGGALIYAAHPSVSVEVGSQYKLYFQSRGGMFNVEATLMRKETQFLAFRFINLTPLDLAEIRGKLARMEMVAAHMCVNH
jgi:PilZ domain